MVAATDTEQLFCGRYTVLNRTIGNGAQATVFPAIDRETGDQLVCKVYNLCGLADKEKAKQKLMLQATLRCQLDHVSILSSAPASDLADIVQPNISAFRGAYSSPYNLYVFEDLATGGDLFSMVARRSKLLQSECRFLVHQILRAVAYMHAKGVAHRDLKLENILCAVCPKPGHRLVITDFGHSTAVGMVGMDDIVGTKGYQAP